MKRTSACLVLRDLCVLFVKMIVCENCCLRDTSGFRPATCVCHLPSFRFQCGLQRTLEHQFFNVEQLYLVWQSWNNKQVWVGQSRIDKDSYHIAAMTNGSNIEKLVGKFAIISNAFLAEQLQQSGEENKGKRSILTFLKYISYSLFWSFASQFAHFIVIGIA